MRLRDHRLGGWLFLLLILCGGMCRISWLAEMQPARFGNGMLWIRNQPRAGMNGNMGKEGCECHCCGKNCPMRGECCCAVRSKRRAESAGLMLREQGCQQEQVFIFHAMHPADYLCPAKIAPSARQSGRDRIWTT